MTCGERDGWRVGGTKSYGVRVDYCAWMKCPKNREDVRVWYFCGYFPVHFVEKRLNVVDCGLLIGVWYRRVRVGNCVKTDGQ